MNPTFLDCKIANRQRRPTRSATQRATPPTKTADNQPLDMSNDVIQTLLKPDHAPHATHNRGWRCHVTSTTTKLPKSLAMLCTAPSGRIDRPHRCLSARLAASIAPELCIYIRPPPVCQSPDVLPEKLFARFRVGPLRAATDRPFPGSLRNPSCPLPGQNRAPPERPRPGSSTCHP